MYKNYKNLVVATFFLSIVVVGLGAYTRLSDAGLGCPDWPGCYGFLTVPKHEADLAHVEQTYPDMMFETAKAWKETLRDALDDIHLYETACKEKVRKQIHARFKQDKDRKKYSQALADKDAEISLLQEQIVSMRNRLSLLVSKQDLLKIKVDVFICVRCIVS